MANYDSIVLSGGGSKAVSLLGLLYEWDIRGQLRDIPIWSCTSVGSFIAVLILTGMNPLQILSYYPSQIESIKPSVDLISSLIKKAGIARIQKYSHKFCAQVEKFMGIPDPTLKQFYEKTGKTIYIEAVNLTTAEVVYFNHIEHPDVSLFSAVWASAAIPGFFVPIKINGDSYCDGGLYNNLPLEPVIDKKIVAFQFKSVEEGSDLLYYLKLNSTIIKKETIKRAKQLTLIDCKCNFGTLDFGKTKTQLVEEFDFGRKQYPNG